MTREYIAPPRLLDPQFAQLQSYLDDYWTRLRKATAYSFGYPTEVRSANCTAQFEDLVRVNCAEAAIDVRLPDLSMADVGRFVVVKDVAGKSHVNAIWVRAAQPINGGDYYFAITARLAAVFFVAVPGPGWETIGCCEISAGG